MVHPEANMEARWQEAIAQCPRSFLASFLDTLSPRLICVGTWSTGHGLNGDHASYHTSLLVSISSQFLKEDTPRALTQITSDG